MKTQIELVPHVLITFTEQEARNVAIAIRELMSVSATPVHPELTDLFHDLNSRLQSLDEGKEIPF